MQEASEWSKFVSHRARMSGEFDSRKDSHSTEFEQRPRILVKLSFIELCNSKLSGLRPFASLSALRMRLVLLITWPFQWVKKMLKSESQAVSSWDTNPWSNFCDPHKICDPGTSEISTPPEIAEGTHFHPQHGTKTNPVFLPADGDYYGLLLSSLASLLSGDTVQPENTYSCILKMTDHGMRKLKRTSININYSYQWRSFP